jgi:alkylation response protein AidB-like acyl-CoA dehydrogenase
MAAAKHGTMRRVDFELSEDQLALREAAASLIEGRAPMTRVRAVAATESRLDDELWSAMAGQGWLAVDRPEASGGLGLGMVEVAVLCEQIGRHLAPVPFLGTVLARGALEAAVTNGTLDAATVLGGQSLTEWADGLSSGEKAGAVAWSRQVDDVGASEDGSGGWVLSGRTDPVVYGSSADVLVVFAGARRGQALFAVALTDEMRPGPEAAMDVTRTISRVELDRMPALLIGDAEQAQALLDSAATGTCAELLGCANRAMEMSVEYAKDRVQFGRPIGSFQAIKHRCADMLVDVEGMRSVAYYAAWAVGASDPDARSAASTAKIWCSDASSRVMASALQVHGGIGFTWEHDMHLFLKRSQLDEVSFGDAVFHRDRLARILRPKAEAGLPIL